MQNDNFTQNPSNDSTQVEEATVVPKESETVLENMLKAEGFVEQNIPELDVYSKYISEKSNGKAHLIVKCDGMAEEINGIVVNDKLSDKYYSVYVGEQWVDHQVNWDWFFVNEDFDEIFWYCLPESEVYTLSEWRNSSHYRQLDK